MSDCIPYKIQVSNVGISTDLFDIRYTITGDTTFQTATTPCGTAATLVTSEQLLTGYSICLPADTDAVYIYDIGGVCDGRYTAYYITTPTPTPTPTITPTYTPTITPTYTPTVTPTYTPTITPTLTITPTYTPTVTPDPAPTITPTYTPTVTPTLTVTPTYTPTVTPTYTPTVTPTLTVTPTYTPTVTPTYTPTVTPTLTITPTHTPTITPTVTPTIEPTYYYYQVSPCDSLTPYVGRSTNSGLSANVYITGEATCIHITGAATGPTYDYDLDTLLETSLCISNPCITGCRNSVTFDVTTDATSIQYTDCANNVVNLGPYSIGSYSITGTCILINSLTPTFGTVTNVVYNGALCV